MLFLRQRNFDSSFITDYNNIYLGKRIFGPARKQVFNYTIVGGMERRFEIVDNQVNHIQFTHEMSDKFIEKCRNPRMFFGTYICIQKFYKSIRR